MKIRIFALCLAICAMVLMTAPPTFAYIPEPLFGVSWRPDLCAGGSPGFSLCVSLYETVVQDNNTAIDLSHDPYGLGGLGGCTDNPCIIAYYIQKMGYERTIACNYFSYNWGGDGEMNAWCFEVYEAMTRDTIMILGGDTGGCNICFKGNVPRIRKADLFFRKDQ